MAGDEESSEDERITELSTIAAIFPELSIDSTDPCSASIEIPISPGKPLSIRFNSPPPSVPSAALPTPPSSNDAQADRTAAELTADQVTPKATEVCLISHLPPLLLRVTLPAGYPTEQAPLLRLESKSSWLSQQKLDELKDAGRTLWEDMGRDQVVFAYIDYLQQAAEDGFGLEIDRGKGLELSQDLEIVLLDFDLKAKRAKFERETFECGVCLGRSNHGLWALELSADLCDRTKEGLCLPSLIALLTRVLCSMSTGLLQFLYRGRRHHKRQMPGAELWQRL